ncbi:unnamed protein product [Sphagnum tenellum]
MRSLIAVCMLMVASPTLGVEQQLVFDGDTFDQYVLTDILSSLGPREWGRISQTSKAAELAVQSIGPAIAESRLEEKFSGRSVDKFTVLCDFFHDYRNFLLKNDATFWTTILDRCTYNAPAYPGGRIWRTHFGPNKESQDSFSEGFRIGDLTWSGVVRDSEGEILEMTQQIAMQYCADLGPGYELPNREDYRALALVMGYGPPGGYNRDAIPDMADYLFWSSSICELSDSYAYFFRGDDGLHDYVIGDHDQDGAVRCVARLG